jgi:hypothetical protein
MLKLQLIQNFIGLRKDRAYDIYNGLNSRAEPIGAILYYSNQVKCFLAIYDEYAFTTDVLTEAIKIMESLEDNEGELISL